MLNSNYQDLSIPLKPISYGLELSCDLLMDDKYFKSTLNKLTDARVLENTHLRRT